MSNEKETQVIEEGAVEETANESVSEDAIFSEIFGNNSDEFVAQIQEGNNPNVAVDEPSEVQGPSDPKEDNSQFQYWQSQADKRQVELDELKATMADVDDVLPIARHLKRNPELINKLSEDSSQVSKATVVEKPVKPKKPSSFDHSEALTDPDSPSAKYMVARDTYVEDMSEYILGVEEKRSMQLEEQQTQQRKATQEQQLIRDLQANYNYTPNQAQDFMTKMSSPESLSLDNLVKLHQMDTGQVQQQSVVSLTASGVDKQQVMSERNKRLSIPKPVSVQPSVNVQSSKKSAENHMMDSMLTDYKKKNPFT